MIILKQILVGLLLLSSVCSSCQTVSISPNYSSQSQENILIVYLSRTKNTQAIASMIHEYVGGTLIELQLQNPYPKDYRTMVGQVSKEKQSGFLPQLKTKINNIEDYDLIFVGFPTWGMQLPPPMRSFLKQNDLSGKTIVPFNTNAGYGIGSSFDQVRQLCPNSKVLEGIAIKGGVERDGILFVMEGEKEKEAKKQVKRWLQRIKKLN